MGRTVKAANRTRVDLFILDNQLADMDKVKVITGKNRTDCIKEAVALWLSVMHREGVI